MVDTTFTLLGTDYLFPAVAKQLFLAAFFGVAIGAERSWHRKPASIRTFAFMCAGSCLFSLLSTIVVGAGGHEDRTRIAAGIVTGIGFLGGGVIFKTTDRIEGITTGAMLFICAAIGMACGFNEIQLAWWGFIVYFSIHLFGLCIYRLIGIIRGQDKAMKRALEGKEGKEVTPI